MKDAILIKFPDHNKLGFTVAQGDKFHDGLTWGEMVEQVIGLTHPQIQHPQYAMKSKRLQEAEKAFHQANMALKDAQEVENGNQAIGIAILRAIQHQEKQPGHVADTAAKEADKNGQSRA